MGRPRRFALALLCATAAGAGWGAARPGGFAWSGIETTATAIWNRGAADGATLASADAGPVGALLAHAIASVAAVTTSDRELGEPAVASAAVPATDAATVGAGPRQTAFRLAGVSAGGAPIVEAPIAEAPIVEAPLPDAGPTTTPETHERLVSLFRPEAPVEEQPVEEEAQPAVRPIEIVDECLVVDTCIDEYLWALYERTPKVDTNKVTKQIKTTVKTKKGKTRTVTKTITDYVVADFTWKDPAAAQKAGMSVKDYVIGGMDRGFKLKLFRAFRMMEDAGFMPGITSAFRDDYRQSIAAGHKAASDSSFHGGSRRGGYGHGLAVDLVSVKGATRLQRFAASEELWKWIDAHERELGVGRPYLDRDPPHVGAIDGKEYAAKRGRSPAQKIAKNEGASGAKSTASTPPPAHKIANNNEAASGAKSTASTPPPARERKKTKRAIIQTVPKAPGTAASSSLRYSDAQTRRTVSPPEY
jgi:hypothetical protein